MGHGLEPVCCKKQQKKSSRPVTGCRIGIVNWAYWLAKRWTCNLYNYLIDLIFNIFKRFIHKSVETENVAYKSFFYLGIVN